jgi:hypothetical protein
MLNNEYYLWGAGIYGGRLIEFVKNDMSFKAVIDNDLEKQGTLFHGLPVISYADAKNNHPDVKIVVSTAMPHEIRNFLLKEGLVQNRDFYLIYDFLPRYYWEKNRLVASHSNLIATTRCNLKCESCQAYITIAANHKHMKANDIIKNVDLMFAHIDSFLNINFPCGESLLNSELPDVCSYIYENYAERYYAMTIQTNRTVTPKDDVMCRFSDSKTVFSISDYPENMRVKERFIEKCNEFNVSYFNNSTCKKENWYDFGDSRVVTETNPEKLRKRFDDCWIPGAGVFEGWLYLCTVQPWSHAVVGAGTREHSDVFDLRKPKTETTREEVYRLISRQPELGYISHCMRCNGAIPISNQ